MHHLRFSKYDIKYRNELGHYLRDDWTSISDVGKVCEGELLTMEEYERVEKNYLDALLDIIQTIGISRFQIYSSGVWDLDTSQIDFPLSEGTIINIEQCLLLSQQTLREKVWHIIKSPKLNIYFGHDYYIYISFDGDLDTVKAIIKKYDLFWEMQEKDFLDNED